MTEVYCCQKPSIPSEFKNPKIFEGKDEDFTFEEIDQSMGYTYKYYFENGHGIIEERLSDGKLRSKTYQIIILYGYMIK